MTKIKSAMVTRVGDAKNIDGINAKERPKLDLKDKHKWLKFVDSTIIFLIQYKSS